MFESILTVRLIYANLSGLPSLGDYTFFGLVGEHKKEETFVPGNTVPYFVS